MTIRLLLLIAVLLFPGYASAQWHGESSPPSCTLAAGALQISIAGSTTRVCGVMEQGKIAQLTDWLVSTDCTDIAAATGGGTGTNLVQWDASVGASGGWRCIDAENGGGGGGSPGGVDGDVQVRATATTFGAVDASGASEGDVLTHIAAAAAWAAPFAPDPAPSVNHSGFDAAVNALIATHTGNADAHHTDYADGTALTLPTTLSGSITNEAANTYTLNGPPGADMILRTSSPGNIVLDPGGDSTITLGVTGTGGDETQSLIIDTINGVLFPGLTGDMTLAPVEVGSSVYWDLWAPGTSQTNVLRANDASGSANIMIMSQGLSSVVIVGSQESSGSVRLNQPNVDTRGLMYFRDASGHLELENGAGLATPCLVSTIGIDTTVSTAPVFQLCYDDGLGGGLEWHDYP